MSDPDREALLDSVAAYALGVVPRSEAAHVAAFVLADPQARREYDRLRATADMLALGVDEPIDAERSARMKSRIMAGITSDTAVPVPQARVGVRRIPLPAIGIAMAAAVAFAFVSIVQNFSLNAKLHEANAKIAATQTQAEIARTTVERDRRMLADLAAGDARRYRVAQGSIVVRGSHVYLAMTTLAALPRGRVYQAWTVPTGSTGVVPSVTFAPSVGNVTLVPLPEDGRSLSAIALSVEPLGGSKKPTSKPLFVQPLS